MNLIKSVVCLILFMAALLGAFWPIVRDGEINWLLDMDIQGGVQIIYKADFSSLPPESRNVQAKRRLMELSHIRLDSRLSNFQGADVRVQILGEDRLLVEVPGIRDIAQVKYDLGKPRIISLGRVVSISTSRDDTHTHACMLRGVEFWLNVEKPLILGNHILYDLMTIQPVIISKSNSEQKFELSLPLDMEGQGKMASLTTAAFDHPASLMVGEELVEVPLIALFLDQEFKDIWQVMSGAIRQGAITLPSYSDADQLKRILSSGPMPIKFDIYAERAISPLLGTAFQNKGFLALAVSILILIVFMSLCYMDRPWFLFVYFVSLFFWFLCIVTLANFHLFRVSLLQLAAFVLLLGMNTDTLILVFEDIRQEFAREKRFSMSLVGEAFKTEWMVVFWGMMTTIVVIVPLALQGGIFIDYIKLLGLGMAVNVTGFIFARLLMSLPLAESVSASRIRIEGLAGKLSHLNPLKIKYRPLGVVLFVIAVIAVFVYPHVPLSPVFKGGKALELQFNTPVQTDLVQGGLLGLIGKDAEIQTEEIEGNKDLTKWVLTKFPADVELEESDIINTLTAATGVSPKILSIEGISETLVAKNRLRVGIETFLGLIFLLIISVFIYNLKAGLSVIVALIHDLLIMLGFMAVLRIDLDLPVIAVLATMIGYSINDSIVILHKMRILKLERSFGMSTYTELKSYELEEITRENLIQVIPRTIITSVTTALPMIVLSLIGGRIFWDYSLLVIVGVFFGTLSSLYIVGRVRPAGFVSFKS